MKTIFISFIIVLFALTSASQTRVEMVHNKNIDTSITGVSFEELEELYYASEHPSLRINFDTLYDYEIHFDGKKTNLNSNRDIYIKNLERGDHTITLIKGKASISKTIKVKSSPPWFSNDATVFGILMIVLLWFSSQPTAKGLISKNFTK